MKTGRLTAWCFTAALLALSMNCSMGGGADVGNPLNGTVINRTPQGEHRVSGAMVVLARRGADPGPSWVGEAAGCRPAGGTGICVVPVFFDTGYTDINGAFQFDSVLPGSYAITASGDGLLALAYVEQDAYRGSDVRLLLDKPATIRVKTYGPVDTAALRFNGVRVSGTGFFAGASGDGSIVLDKVPAADLDLIFYRSDTTTVLLPAFSTTSGCEAEIDIDPDLPWTPKPCGARDPRGRPYILQADIPVMQGDSAGIFRDGRRYDLRIAFSHDMNALTFEKALHAFSADTSARIGTWWWDGGNVLYVSLCIADSAGACRSGEERFKKAVSYGVTIDTTARTSVGVAFAHEVAVRFVPVP